MKVPALFLLATVATANGQQTSARLLGERYVATVSSVSSHLFTTSEGGGRELKFSMEGA